MVGGEQKKKTRSYWTFFAKHFAEREANHVGCLFLSRIHCESSSTGLQSIGGGSPSSGAALVQGGIQTFCPICHDEDSDWEGAVLQWQTAAQKG